MKLTILGSGTAVPLKNRSAPANYLKIKDKNILVDCGSGAIRQLEKSGNSYKDLDYIFLTHFHPDHFSDLTILIEALNYTPNFTRKKDLIILDPVGIKSFFSKYIAPIEGVRPKDFKIKIREIVNEVHFEDFRIEILNTNHNRESIAYKFTEKKKSLVISGDCGFEKGLIDFSKSSKVLLLECSQDSKKRDNGHLNSKECGIIARESKASKLILTHLYTGSSEKVRLQEAKTIFPKTVLAEDFMEIEI